MYKLFSPNTLGFQSCGLLEVHEVLKTGTRHKKAAAIRILSCLTSSRFQFRRLTPQIRLKAFQSENDIVSADSGHPGLVFLLG